MLIHSQEQTECYVLKDQMSNVEDRIWWLMASFNLLYLMTVESALDREDNCP